MRIVDLESPLTGWVIGEAWLLKPNEQTNIAVRVQRYVDGHGWPRLALKYCEYYFLLQSSFNSKLTQPVEQEYYYALG
jgi:hypothetical protein